MAIVVARIDSLSFYPPSIHHLLQLQLHTSSPSLATNNGTLLWVARLKVHVVPAALNGLFVIG